MKTIQSLVRLLCACLALDGILIANAADYLEQFEEIKKGGERAEIEQFLAEAAKSEAENPDYFATAGNYWWGLSQSVNISTKPTDKGDFSVRDQKTGKEVGSMSTLGKADPALPKKALALLEEGARRFPARADLMLGLAHVQRETGMQSECVNTLVKLLGTAKTNANGLRWKKNGKLPSPPDEFIPETVQRYSGDLFNAASPEMDALSAKLCDATIDAFPNHPFAYNMKAVLANAANKPAEALRFLETASEKAPNDTLILLNLGDAYRKAGQGANAKKTYQRVLDLKKAEDAHKKDARDALKKLRS
jgi:tetratricopeptide (TPR) repeat protein